MINYQKKKILVKDSNITIIRHPAKGKHNETTIAIVNYAIPLARVLKKGAEDISVSAIKAATDAVSGFQTTVKFNGNMVSPALLFTIKTKTERRGDDTPNQELADRLVVVKADARASALAAKAIEGFMNFFMDRSKSLAPIAEVCKNYSIRETTYFKKA